MIYIEMLQNVELHQDMYIIPYDKTKHDFSEHSNQLPIKTYEPTHYILVQ